jgi:hypothetical protein
MSDPTPCPVDCPNRLRNATQGKLAAYVFALICAGFLAFQCLSADRRDEEVSPMVWMPLLLLTGMGLGVQIDPSDLLKWMKN